MTDRRITTQMTRKSRALAVTPSTMAVSLAKS
jgi:hypothetical protein